MYSHADARLFRPRMSVSPSYDDPIIVGETWQEWLDRDLARRREANLLRTIEIFKRENQWVGDSDGRRLLNYMSNDYLGLSCHPAVIAAVSEATHFGTGATSARLMAGTDQAYASLEQKFAQFHSVDRALIFGSGYLANLGTISSLVGRDDAVFSDRLNHASIVDGCQLSNAKHYRYQHGDIRQLESMLRDADERGFKRKLIVTESVFSMDGDVAPLQEIVELRDRFGAALMVDEAHALGVFGDEGKGYVAELGLSSKIDLLIGTFGKALGGYGAYVAAGRSWIDFLVNAARTFVFSTALPPPVIAGVDTALGLLRLADEPRARIRLLADILREQLRAVGLDVMCSNTQIVPVVIGASGRTLSVSETLRNKGILARPIRPPTVPQNSSRLRLSVTSEFTIDDIDRTVAAVRRSVGES